MASINARASAVPPRDYFRHQVWSTEEGLPQASVHALLQSHEGYLWIATERGIARFDGQSFQVFSQTTVPAFVSSDISCLAEVRSGDLWFGTSDGLVRKQGEHFRRFSVQDGLPSDQIVALATTSTDLLVLTTSGLAALRSDHFVRVGGEENITDLRDTDAGPILVSKSGAMYQWSEGRLIAIVTAPQTRTTLGAMIGRKQAIWTYGKDYVQFSSQSRTRTWYTGGDLPGNRVQAFYIDPAGRSWIGTNRGLVSIDAAGSVVREYEELRGESVLSVLLDRERDLWVGTEASGLHALQPRKFATLPGSTSEAVTTLARDKRGVMYFGTRDDGLFRVDGATVSALTKNLTSPVVLSLAAGPDNNLWAGTPDGLNEIVGTEVHRWTIADGLPDNFVRSVIVAADHTAWAGTRFGLAHIDGHSVETFTTADGLASDSIGPLLEQARQDGTSVLWVGTSAGLCEKAARRFHCISPPGSADGKIVTAVAADRNADIWAAFHDDGLGVVTGGRVAPVRISAVPKEIVGILADPWGYLWLRSSSGLIRARVSDLRTCATTAASCSNVRIERFGRSDHMQSDELAGEGNVPASEGTNGELWFATRRGIAITDAEHLRADPIPPGVVVTQVRVDGNELDLGEMGKVEPGQRQISLQFAGLSLNNATQCRYMLDGFDPGWIAAGSMRTAFYTNLPPRRYNFRVLCANRDGLWSKDEADFPFLVVRPWYRRAWFYVLVACAIMLGVWGIIQLRVRAERRRFGLVLQERTRVAREVHDTLAQDLVSVSLQVDMAAQHAKAGRLSELTEQLMQTRCLVRESLESARQSIWNLRANLPQESLPVRLAARVEAVQNTGVSSRLRVSGEYRSVEIGVENELMRIATEAISNAERHSGASEILVQLTYGPDSLLLQLKDNGGGFDYSSARGRNDRYGLRGIEERAASLGARLTVDSISGEGTTVTLVARLSRRNDAGH